MVIREKKRGGYGSRAFLIYPKRRCRSSSGLAGWLQARVRVRAISISEQCIYAACASVLEHDQKRKKEHCISVCLCDRKRIRIGERGHSGKRCAKVEIVYRVSDDKDPKMSINYRFTRNLLR